MGRLTLDEELEEVLDWDCGSCLDEELVEVCSLDVKNHHYCRKVFVLFEIQI